MDIGLFRIKGAYKDRVVPFFNSFRHFPLRLPCYVANNKVETVKSIIGKTLFKIPHFILIFLLVLFLKVSWNIWNISSISSQCFYYNLLFSLLFKICTLKYLNFVLFLILQLLHLFNFVLFYIIHVFSTLHHRFFCPVKNYLLEIIS